MIDQFQAFKDVALSQGYRPEEVDAFARMAESAQGVKKAREEEEWQRELARRSQTQKQDELVKSQTVGEDPLRKVYEQYGGKYLTGKDKDARYSQAQAINDMGLEKYLKNMPLPDLLDDKENAARDASAGIMVDLSTISDIIAGSGKVKNIQGVGPLGKFRPGFATNEQGTTLRQKITQFTADRLKQISGAVITDREAARLTQALPQVNDTEQKIYEKTKNIQNSIEIGLEMQELAKRNKMTLDQAYMQFGADAFGKRGLPVPSWIAKNDKLESTPPTLGGSASKVGRFEVRVK